MSGSATVPTGSFHPHSRHRLAITDVSLLHEDICVQYLVTPAPTELLARCQLDLSVRGGLARAIAVHSSRGHARADVRGLSANP